MRIHTLIHAPFEEAGVIKSWALDKGHQLSSTHTYNGEELPDAASIDFLVIMGGPQSCTELDKYPYLRDEIALAKEIIAQNKPVLGVCLGAQIIGETLGAKTERSPAREIGVYPIHLTKAAETDPLFKTLPQSFDVMHWHNDMPGLPADAELLAYSEGCPRQIIKYGKKVYGLQCHMELTSELVKAMLAHCPADLKPGKYVQQKQELLSQDLSAINRKMFAVLDALVNIS
jgi:GMP synthase (glutamine-hydrolysing)